MDSIEWAGIAELGEALDSQSLSVVELTQACLDRISKHDGKTNSVLALNPDVLDIAAAHDQERSDGKATGPLHGIPVMVKDNMDTGDRMATTAGSLSLQGTFASSDCPVVANLRAAGAVLLGKANLSEWANFRSARSVSGWSSLGGQTRNPHALDRTPGGSSSGSGVVVAAGYCPAAVGTETSGSIVNPAAMNGVVGIKPTIGLVSRTGIVPISSSQDTAGPMARTVTDAAILLSAISGSDPADTVTADADRRKAQRYADFANLDGLKGKRIGLAVNYCGFDERVDAVLANNIRAIRDAGGEVIEVELVAVETIRPFEFEVMLHEFKAEMNTYLSTRDQRTTIRTLDDIVAFNRANAERAMPYFPQDILEMALDRGHLDCQAYLDARAGSLRTSRDEGLDRVINENRLDAVMAATSGLPWLIDWINGDNRRGTSAGPAAAAGYPNISVPAGYVYGLPINVSFMGTAWSEPGLISIAAGFEHVVQARKAPAFQPTAHISPGGEGCLPASFSPRKEGHPPW